MIEPLNKKEKAWLEEVLSISLDEHYCPQPDVEAEQGRRLNKLRKMLGPKSDDYELSDLEFWPGFEYHFEPLKKGSKAQRGLWIVAPDMGSLEQAALLVHGFMREFNKPGVAKLTARFVL
jgi:hypothetical protein